MPENYISPLDVEYDFYFEFTDVTGCRSVIVFWGRKSPFNEVKAAMERYFEREVTYRPLKGIHTPLMEFV